MYGVSEIGARFCLETPGVDSLDMTGIAQAVPTVASAQTILDAVRQPNHYLKDKQLIRYPGIVNGDITTPAGEVLRASQWGGTSHPIWFSRDARVRNCKMLVAMWNQELYKKELELERANKVSLQWIPDEKLYPMLDAMATAITPDTPPRESRFVHRAIDVCVGSGNTVMVRSTMLSTGGYYTTGLMQAYGAMRLLNDRTHVTGFASPCEAFDHKELLGALQSYGYSAFGLSASFDPATRHSGGRHGFQDLETAGRERRPLCDACQCADQPDERADGRRVVSGVRHADAAPGPRRLSSSTALIPISGSRISI